MTPPLHEAAATLAGLLRRAGRAVALTGAGISTESGIPDFRSPGGVWSRHQPVLYQDFLRDISERRRYWEIRRETVPAFAAAQPGDGHRVLAHLERTGRLIAVITQNIDELHQRAGSRRVVELHGTAMVVRCLSCDDRCSALVVQERLEAGEGVPPCLRCGGILKSMTVSFGENLSEAVLAEARELTQSCDLFLAIGSSLVVHPAAALPDEAKTAGASLVILNREPTPLDSMADLVVRAEIGPFLNRVVEELAR